MILSDREEMTRAKSKTTGQDESEFIRKAENSLARYCAYQDRTEEQAREKLLKMGVGVDQADRILKKFITEGFIDEQRYANSFVLGKFRNNKWGKSKILYALKARKISDEEIGNAFTQLEEGEYLEQMKKLINKKRAQVKEKNPALKQNKIARYMQSKGYESGLVWKILNGKETGEI